MIAGNGFFKPNISSMVGQMYKAGDKRTDSAYTIFYMGINVGGMVGPFICGLVGNTGDPDDFKWAFPSRSHRHADQRIYHVSLKGQIPGVA